MKKRNYGLVMLLLATSIHAQDWPRSGQEASPGTRWWWLGSAVDKENLTYNLEEYAKNGIGAVEITPIYGVQGNDKNNIPFLNKEWMEMLQHTQNEGKRLGIDVDMNTGTGWPFGGPSVSIQDAASKAIFQQYQLTGGKMVEMSIAVQDEKQQSVATLSRLMAYSDDNKKVVDLTSKVRNGRLKWQAPDGDWQLVALYVGKTLQKVKRAAPGGEGYVMDHLNKGAVKRYLQNFENAFKTYKATYPHTFFNDSYEVYQADWTPDFLEQFAKRRGYKLENHFLEFLDKERNGNTPRIMSDYRETMSDLLLENFTRQWTAWAHSHGSITRNQAHGSPANLIDVYAAVDIPECEGFGLSEFHIKGLRKDAPYTKKNDSDLSMLKYASSAAHIAGKPFTSSETFTWLTEHFRTSLSQCKPDMDLMFVSGINHAYFHGATYSPKEAEWPGWRFYASIDMTPANSIWRDAPAFFQYITRCQSFLQMGRPDNDFLVYLPVYDMWEEQPGRLLMFSIHDMGKRAPKFIKTVNTISDCGYDMDYVSDAFLRTTACRDGNLITQGGTTYKAIIVPGVKRMPEDVFHHLLGLAKQGATVIFTENYPEDVPGFGKLEDRRKQFSKAMQQLPVADFSKTTISSFGKGKIICGSDYTATLQHGGAEPESMKTEYGLKCIRRSNDTGYHYFISSLQEKGAEGWMTLAVPATDVMIFNPMTGEKGLARTRNTNGKTEVYLQLQSGESLILQTFNQPLTEKVDSWTYLQEQSMSLGLEHGWSLTFTDSEPKVTGTFNIDTPRSWTTIDAPNTKTTMATGVYSIEIELPTIKADEWILDLGDVRESAKVTINGEYVGTAWAVPYQLKVGKFLRQGKNKIEIAVTNLPANRIAEMDRNGKKWRIFNEINVVNLQYKPTLYSDWTPVPSGLNGNVCLIPMTAK